MNNTSLLATLLVCFAVTTTASLSALGRTVRVPRVAPFRFKPHIMPRAFSSTPGSNVPGKSWSRKLKTAFNSTKLRDTAHNAVMGAAAGSACAWAGTGLALGMGLSEGRIADFEFIHGKVGYVYAVTYGGVPGVIAYGIILERDAIAKKIHDLSKK